MSTPEGPEFQSFGDFEIRRLLGEGGTAVVYHAVNTLVGADVALKVLRESLGEDQRRRFLAECRAQWELAEHPQVVRLYWAGAPEGGQAWLAVELYERSLAERLRQGPPLTLEEILQITDDLLSGLAAVHHAGLIHRDVKPANVMLKGGRAALGDFGLAMLVEDWTRDAGAGTARYIAPELAAGAPPSWRSDVYAASVTIRTMFGEQPPGPIDAVLTRAASFSPADRPEDAWALLGALRGARAALRASPTDRTDRTDRTWTTGSAGTDAGSHTDPGPPIALTAQATRPPAGKGRGVVLTVVAAVAVVGIAAAIAVLGPGAADRETTGQTLAPSAKPVSTAVTPGPTTEGKPTEPSGTGTVTVVYNECPALAGERIFVEFIRPGNAATVVSSALMEPFDKHDFTLTAGRYWLYVFSDAPAGKSARSVGFIDVTVRPGEQGAVRTGRICGASGVPLGLATASPTAAPDESLSATGD